MKNVSAGKVTKGANARPSLSVSAPQGSKPMPRVGGHTSNITPTQGVPSGGKGGC